MYPCQCPCWEWHVHLHDLAKHTVHGAQRNVCSHSMVLLACHSSCKLTGGQPGSAGRGPQQHSQAGIASASRSCLSTRHRSDLPSTPSIVISMGCALKSESTSPTSRDPLRMYASLKSPACWQANAGSASRLYSGLPTSASWVCCSEVPDNCCNLPKSCQLGRWAASIHHGSHMLVKQVLTLLAKQALTLLPIQHS